MIDRLKYKWYIISSQLLQAIPTWTLWPENVCLSCLVFDGAHQIDFLLFELGVLKLRGVRFFFFSGLNSLHLVYNNVVFYDELVVHPFSVAYDTCSEPKSAKALWPALFHENIYFYIVYTLLVMRTSKGNICTFNNHMAAEYWRYERRKSHTFV